MLHGNRGVAFLWASVAAADHHFDGSSGAGAGRFEGPHRLLQFEAVRDERFDVDPSTGHQVQGDGVAVQNNTIHRLNRYQVRCWSRFTFHYLVREQVRKKSQKSLNLGQILELNHRIRMNTNSWFIVRVFT